MKRNHLLKKLTDSYSNSETDFEIDNQVLYHED